MILVRQFLFALVLGSGLASAAQAQIAPPAPPTREEIRREQLDQRLRLDGDPVAVGDAVERAACPLADPRFADLRFTFSGAEFSGLGEIDPGMLAGAWQPYVGQELPVAAICEIRDRAATILRQSGYLAAVRVPVQEIDDGRVDFDVIVARLAQVQIRGEAGPSARVLQRYIDRLSGQPLFNIAEAERYLLLARDIPGLDVRLSLQPVGEGGTPGDVVGVFDVERTPVTADLNVQNYGSKSVGRIGAFGRVTLNGLTGLGDRTTLGLFTTADWDEQHLAQLGHEFRVGSEGLTLGGDFTYAWTTPDLPGPDPFSSETLVASLWARYPVLRSQTRNLSATAGFDLIDQDTDFGSLPLSRDRLRVAFARLQYDSIDAGSLRGAGGYSAVEPKLAFAALLELRQGISVLGASRDCGPTFANCVGPGVVPPARLDADPTAFVVRAEARLDVRPHPLLAISFQPRAQWSPDALYSYEQVSGGNYTIGRGYDPGATIGDSGIGGTVELAYGSLIPKTPRGVAFQPYVFFDLLATGTKNLPGDPRTITAVGGGLRAMLGQRAFLDVTGAVPLERGPFQASRGDARLLVNLTIQLAPWRR
ncbi:ShlB/FhaC/HecB family hemolysin secretion/activation protein [Altererythrobacter sp. H2]|uniref:ShlB/FhaC/HecB family hemolysin secretion/activation protein n=1 Tax=Altererythrobacter sp. H2 TaxID=3108391 RepID=UPI002B4BF53F|nr:ShlB/FhaC/HecB family hemolysin secretion/activation protein [Altererythrobacter sp. H2]WRK94710.1 ShlB/FhaC/HecB family hemolysin secretion/activation protein [Altererythrobacter sp. H2]